MLYNELASYSDIYDGDYTGFSTFYTGGKGNLVKVSLSLVAVKLARSQWSDCCYHQTLSQLWLSSYVLVDVPRLPLFWLVPQNCSGLDAHSFLEFNYPHLSFAF